MGYFLALANGDCRQQHQIMSEWVEAPGLKVQWVQAFLTSLYYNELLGQDIIVDPLTHSIESGRAEIISGFCNRLNVDGPPALVPYWEQMIAFWSQPKTNNETELRLRLALFEDLVNRKLPEPIPSVRVPEFIPPRPVIRRLSELNPRHKNSQEGDRRADSNAELRYLEPEDVRAIISRTSFFIQHYGRLMNAAFTVFPAYQARSSEEPAVETVERFRKELAELAASGGEPFATVTLLERDEDGVFGQIVAHIPQLASKHPEPNAYDQFLDWCSDWPLYDRDTDKPVVECSVAIICQELKFHWDQILNLCAAVGEEDLKNRDALCGPPLLKQLKIPKGSWRQPGPLRHRLVLFSDLLSQQEVEAASELRMEPLSAFDSKAWGWIRNGWELREYRDRQHTLDKRRRQIQEINQIWSRDEQQLRTELDKVCAEWPADPERRRRSWSGWWHPVR